MADEEFSEEVIKLRPRKLRLEAGVERPNRAKHPLSNVYEYGIQDVKSCPKRQPANNERSQKWRTFGASTLMLASGAAVMIFGTEHWRWDATTATLLALACIGLTACVASEFFSG
ncbi:hypothetical protein [Phaeobacter inhibens]|uniref:hypothetical protein n=1 Tax=Phaeobacter inhibens TaxID=221822 RepID=UPI0021A9086C|nr:hypothetical protein [Phaeobacter inhibens]UWR48930.1 hypothetical protein K4F87_16820 [Phaeobacter inhibens]